jgi:hypothetical protein
MSPVIAMLDASGDSPHEEVDHACARVQEHQAVDNERQRLPEAVNTTMLISWLNCHFGLLTHRTKKLTTLAPEHKNTKLTTTNASVSQQPSTTLR